MKTIQSEYVKTDEYGKRWWRRIVTSTSKPDVMYISGENVDGIPDGDGLAAGSVLLTPDGNEVFYVDGAFGVPGEGLIDVRFSPDLPGLKLSPAVPALGSGSYQSIMKFCDVNVEWKNGDIYTATAFPSQGWHVLGDGDWSKAGEPATSTMPVQTDGNGLLYLHVSFTAAPADGGDGAIELVIEIRSGRYVITVNNGEMDKTWNEIHDKFEAGKPCIVYYPGNDEWPPEGKYVTECLQTEHGYIVVLESDDVFFTVEPDGYPIWD